MLTVCTSALLVSISGGGSDTVASGGSGDPLVGVSDFLGTLAGTASCSVC